MTSWWISGAVISQQPATAACDSKIRHEGWIYTNKNDHKRNYKSVEIGENRCDGCSADNRDWRK